MSCILGPETFNKFYLIDIQHRIFLTLHLQKPSQIFTSNRVKFSAFQHGLISPSRGAVEETMPGA